MDSRLGVDATSPVDHKYEISVLAANQHFLDDRSDDFLLEHGGAFGRIPGLLEMSAEMLEPQNRLFVEVEVGLPGVLQRLFSLCDGAELVIPSPLELGRDESILGIGFIVLLERTPGLVAKLFETTLEHRELFRQGFGDTIYRQNTGLNTQG